MQTNHVLENDTTRELPIILLIDDDLVSREVTATVLIMRGYTVHTAEDGEASLRLLESGACDPEVILMDAQMPGLSGLDLIAALRERSPAGLYAISGSNPPPQVVAAVDGFLLKPFDSDALAKLIQGRPVENTPSHPDSVEPVVSLEVLAQLRQMMSEKAVRQIYAAIVSDLAVRIEALGIAISKGDVAEIRRIGHAIKGGCGMAGAMQIASLGAKLETVPLEPRGNRSDNSAALLSELRAATQGLHSMLDAELPA